MPLNNMNVGVDKTNDLAWLSKRSEPSTVRVLMSLIFLTLRLLVGLGLGWASWGNSFHSVTLTPLIVRCSYSSNAKKVKQKTKIFTLQFLQNDFLQEPPVFSISVSSWGISISSQIPRDSFLQLQTNFFNWRYTFLGVDILQISQTPQWLIDPVYTYKHIRYLTYKSSNHQNH